jgi:hypothetical protein
MRNRERFESLGIQPAEVPDEFLCPITCEKMVDPVVASDGRSYERSTITLVLSQPDPLSPLTREPLRPDVIIPNWNLKKRIEDWETELLQTVERAVARQSALASANQDSLRKKKVLRESIAQRRASLVLTQQQQQQSRRSSVWRRMSSASGKARASVATPSATESSLEADLAAAELAMLEAELAEAEAEAERLTQIA